MSDIGSEDLAAAGARRIHVSYYAAEVEVALISLLWHEPDLLGITLRQLDPAAHLVVPAHRWILEAVQIVYGENSCCDFALVVEVLRELGRLEDCGDLQGLNALYSQNWGYRSLLPEYVAILKEYATQRGVDPHRPVYRYAGGSGNLGPNKLKTQQKHPTYTGSMKLCGRRYELQGWPVVGGQINFKAVPALQER
jgi:DnaB-like helicase N terminal domain